MNVQNYDFLLVLLLFLLLLMLFDPLLHNRNIELIEKLLHYFVIKVLLIALWFQFIQVLQEIEDNATS